MIATAGKADELRVSANVRAAHELVCDNLELLAAVAAAHQDDFGPDDAWIRRCMPLGSTLCTFIEEYEDSDRESFHRAIPICGFGPRSVVMAFAATVAGLLYEHGCTDVGVAIVNNAGRGAIFQYRSREDVVCREITTINLSRTVQ